jgi:hypothetical protein
MTLTIRAHAHCLVIHDSEMTWTCLSYVQLLIVQRQRFWLFYGPVPALEACIGQLDDGIDDKCRLCMIMHARSPLPTQRAAF